MHIKYTKLDKVCQYETTIRYYRFFPLTEAHFVKVILLGNQQSSTFDSVIVCSCECVCVYAHACVRVCE